MTRAASRRAQLAATAILTGGLTLALALGLDLRTTHPAMLVLVLVLFALNTAMLAGAATIALAGMRGATRQSRREDLPDAPQDRCAILWLVCGEDPVALAQRIAQMLQELRQTGQSRDCRIFVLSDTAGAAALAQEQDALAPVAADISYRNRAIAKGRKPGNLHDWLTRHGGDFQTMLVLDADSGFAASELLRLRAQMAQDQSLGLIQKAIRLRPAETRFARMQRVSSRISGPVFAQGLARLSGDAGNFWGHNALLRVDAFRQVSSLPQLSGRPPFGGAILSHDFIEAAFLRRAGWKVVIDPDSRGSFEDAPTTLAAHLRRDRRWAQGNLQHLRLIGGRGLHMVSRMHLLNGIYSYLSAPVWLLLVLLTGSGAVHATGWVILPLLGILALLLVPKLAGLRARRTERPSPWRQNILRRAVWVEIAQTTLFAPISMIRRTGFVLAIALGRDHGWVPSGQLQAVTGRALHAALPGGRVEMLSGAAILLAIVTPQYLIISASAAVFSGFLVLPVILPLLAAPLLYRWFDAQVTGNKVASYYDASTRRFLTIGGSGQALAIHRPLWADGMTTPEDAASHVNTLIAQIAEDVLGHPPRQVRDLGCGVGGTLFQLARRWPDTALCGITISAEQVRLAQAHASARNLDGRCRFLRSDFCLPMTLPPADLLIAIESHVHAPAAEDFLRAAMRQLEPGGALIIVDDMLKTRSEDLTSTQADRVAAFRRGWRLGHVPDINTLHGTAQALGFETVLTHDLTPLLRLDRLRDRALRHIAPLVDRPALSAIPFFGNMIGGNALTEGYRDGVMGYSIVVLRRPLADSHPEAECPGRQPPRFELLA